MLHSVTARDLAPGMVALLGIPWDEKSSARRGAAEAPAAIRALLHDENMNWSTESRRDLRSEEAFVDAGDLALSSGDVVNDEIARGVADHLARGARVLSLGGDHAVAFPVIRAHAAAYPGLNIVQVDAHPDLYDDYEGDRYSHACPFARLMESGLVRRLVQVGIRASTPHQWEQAERFGIDVIDMPHWDPTLPLTFDGPVYLSLDLDGIDPAFAPGVAHPEPGGLTTRDVITLIQSFRGTLVGAEVVELLPSADPQGLTTALAAKLVKELADRLLTDAAR